MGRILKSHAFYRFIHSAWVSWGAFPRKAERPVKSEKIKPNHVPSSHLGPLENTEMSE